MVRMHDVRVGNVCRPQDSNPRQHVDNPDAKSQIMHYYTDTNHDTREYQV